MSPQGARALRALVLVALGLAGVGAAAQFDGGGQAGGPGAPAALSAEEAVRRMGRGDDVLQGLLPAAGDAPSWFTEEVADVAGRDALTANGDWSVASWTVPAGADAALEATTEELRARGWAVVESGVAQAVTCVKEGGRCQWLWIGCTEVGVETRVVVQAAVDPSS